MNKQEITQEIEHEIISRLNDVKSSFGQISVRDLTNELNAISQAILLVTDNKTANKFRKEIADVKKAVLNTSILGRQTETIEKEIEKEIEKDEKEKEKEKTQNIYKIVDKVFNLMKKNYNIELEEYGFESESESNITVEVRYFEKPIKNLPETIEIDNYIITLKQVYKNPNSTTSLVWSPDTDSKVSHQEQWEQHTKSIDINNVNTDPEILEKNKEYRLMTMGPAYFDNPEIAKAYNVTDKDLLERCGF